MDTAMITVRSGELMALRLFDIAYAIDLPAAEAAWRAHAGGSGSRARLLNTPAKAMAFDEPPLQLSMEPQPLLIDGLRFNAQISARLYDFGVLALSVRVPLSEVSWADFAARFNAMERALGSAADAWWGQLRDQLRHIVAAALERPTPGDTLQEDYLIGKVHTLSEPLDAQQLRPGSTWPRCCRARRGRCQRPRGATCWRTAIPITSMIWWC